MTGADCAYCGRAAEGNCSIHRDGVGPEVDLCDACGQHERPTCKQIWRRIARPQASEPNGSAVL